ncbi:MAG TPA: ATP-binding protein [Longimicrobium sp.]|nr:ATP-binding protein [Longimicrobium sp.]
MQSQSPFHGRISDARGRVAELRRRAEAAGAAGEVLLSGALDELALALEELEVSDEELRAQNESLAASQLMLETERQRYADLFHYAPEPYLVTGPDGTIRESNRAAGELLGVAERSLAGKPVTVFVAGDERRAFRDQVNRAAGGARVRDYEVTLLPRRGEAVRVSCTIQPAARLLPGGQALWWMLRDVSELHRAAQAERMLAAEQAARAAADDARERLEAVLEATSDAFFSVDAEGCFTHVNGRAAAAWGRAAPELEGKTIEACFPGVDAEFDALKTALREQRPVRVETHSPVVGRWVEVHAFPTDGGAAAFFHDVEERHRRVMADHLLSGAGDALAGSLEVEEMLRALTSAAAGPFAEWCAAHVPGPAGVGACASAHADAGLAERLQALLADARLDPLGPHPVAVALRTGEPALLAATDEVLDAAFPDPVERETARALGLDSALVVPMQARGRTLGVLTFVRGAGVRAFDGGDLALSCEVARRAAMAVDNARLFEEARAATRAREEVLAVVSHDLRNPLNAVLLGAVILDDYSDPDRWTERDRQQIRAIRSSAEQMTSLIHDLVEVVALEAGTRMMQAARLEPAKAIRSAAEMYEGLAAEKGVALQVPRCDVPDVQADRARVLQVLSNLLGNALKFTPPGGEVTVVAERAGDAVAFRVADTGEGIAPEHLPRLFDRFWQAERGNRKGLGLGLAIAKGIVEAHGGRIWAESEPGRGSSFHFTLPVFRSPEA